MKSISPINLFYNGKNATAEIFELYCITDNLKDAAQFYYSLRQKDDQPSGTVISSGNLLMNNDDYANNWNTNDEAYSWAANKLGLTITGDYVNPEFK